MICLGIDPGQKGGIVMLDEAGVAVFMARMPDTETEIWKLIKKCDFANLAMIEKVHSMPKQGVASTFKFGRGYGGLIMALTAAGISHEYVTPQAWQKFMGIKPRDTKTESKNDHKKKIIARAQALFPNEEQLLTTDAPYIADALLITEYARRTRG